MHNSTIPGLTPRTDVLTVTPDLAREWLTRNTHNRPVRKTAIAKYARDMAAGHWAMNGESIKFAIDGTLLDGQHRLLALIAADTSVNMLIVSGLVNTSQATMDAGAKRTTGDALSLNGEKHSQMLASVLKKVWMWDRGDYKLSSNVTPSTAECAALLAERPEIHRSVEVAVWVRQTFKALQPSITGTAHHLFSRIAPDEAVWFFARVADGVELSPGHPILALRARVVNEAQDRTHRADPYLRLAYLIRAWNAVREDRPIRRILQGPKDLVPMPK
ncbi:hypothetical protein [Streptomyces boncukensis]|uniref:Uncharacterized protein n=1 Tax=Streptomyces boncukensis TaxID=2711219 RepID=A0A6G4X943_9ACTN|nr:hypothetical protein [Streptomyces boncukensis]NGO73181.1 hypothetical protein [Streptomyces boncukensis]